MKPTHITYLFLAALSVAAAMSATSCGKDSLNPDVLDLPACEFTLTASETRGTDHVLPWTISKDGKTDSIEESLDEMYVTAYNELTLNVEPSGTGFQGVNVRSTKANVVRVTKIDDKHYSLTYIADGESDIEVWNGSSGTELKTVFKVKAKQYIELEKVIWVLDHYKIEGMEHTLTGQTELACHLFKSTTEIDDYEFKVLCNEGVLSNKFDYNYNYAYCKDEYDAVSRRMKVIHNLHFARLVPENASCRNVRFVARFFYTLPGYKYGQPWEDVLRNEYNLAFDWTSYSGDISGLTSNVYIGQNQECKYGYLASMIFRGPHYNAFCPFEMQLYGGPSKNPRWALLYFISS